MPFLSASRRRPRLVPGALVLFAVLLGAAAAQQEAEAPVRRGVLDEPVPDLELSDLDGGMVALRDLAGKVVVYDFWAVWCGPCEQSLPFFQALQDRYADDGLVVVGLHVDDGRPEPAEVKAWIEERGVRYPNLFSTIDMEEAMRIFAMPTTYIADRDGIVRLRHIGFNPSRTPERLEGEVRDLLGLE